MVAPTGRAFHFVEQPVHFFIILIITTALCVSGAMYSIIIGSPLRKHRYDINTQEKLSVEGRQAHTVNSYADMSW